MIANSCIDEKTQLHSLTPDNPQGGGGPPRGLPVLERPCHTRFSKRVEDVLQSDYCAAVEALVKLKRKSRLVCAETGLPDPSRRERMMIAAESLLRAKNAVRLAREHLNSFVIDGILPRITADRMPEPPVWSRVEAAGVSDSQRRPSAS